MDIADYAGSPPLNYSAACVLAEMGPELGPKEARNLGITTVNTEEAQDLCGAGYKALAKGLYTNAMRNFIEAIRQNPFVPGPYEGMQEVLQEASLSIECLKGEHETTSRPRNHQYRPRTRLPRRPDSCGISRRPACNNYSEEGLGLRLKIGSISLGLSQDRKPYTTDSSGNKEEGDGSLRQKVYPTIP